MPPSYTNLSISEEKESQILEAFTYDWILMEVIYFIRLLDVGTLLDLTYFEVFTHGWIWLEVLMD